MRVFVTVATGATGLIGSAIVKELVGAGHHVPGMTRSDAGAKSLDSAGAKAHRGDPEDLENLHSGVSAYIGDGQNRWPAAHVTDGARLYLLALETGTGGARYHAVAEEGVALKDIATAIGRGPNLPVISVSQEQAQEHFGILGFFAARNPLTSSAQIRRKLGWNPPGPSLLTDLGNMRYSEV